MNKEILSIITIVVIIFMLSGCKSEPKVTILGTEKPVINSPAPDFITKNIMTGQYIHLSAYKSTVTVVNLWATWCPPCRQEIPSMNRFYKHYNGNVAIIAISLDKSSDKDVLNFANFANMSFDVAHDDGTLNKVYGTGRIPTTYILNKKGIIVDIRIGSDDWDSPEMYEYFDKLVVE